MLYDGESGALLGANSIEDAPNDGKKYLRESETWSELDNFQLSSSTTSSITKTTSGQIQGDGSGGVDFSPSSDLRIKHDIVDAPVNLNDLMTLQVKQFCMNGGTLPKYGFIAQDVYTSSIPELVSLPKDGNDGTTELPEVGTEEYNDALWGVKESKLVPMLVKWCQDLKLQNDDLISRIEVLEGR
jgi:hypothetical protein